MEISRQYIIAAIVVLFAIGAAGFFKRGRKDAKRVTPLAGLAYVFVFAGILSGDSRFLSFGLLGAGVIVGVIDSIVENKKKKKN